MNMNIQYPTSSFGEGLEALLRQRLASFRAETSGLHPRSSRFQDLTQGLLADAKLLETSAWALKSECNTQASAVNTLPPEILSQVFTMVAETERPLPPYDLRALGSFEARLDEFGVAHAHDEDTFGDVEEPSWLKGRRGTLGWITLSHVCNLWRRLLLSSSALWAGDVGALPDALHTMLDRAGNTRFLIVRVYGATFRRHDTAFWKLMAADDGAIARRIREIHCIEQRLGYLQDEVFPHLALCPLMSLEELDISAYEDDGGGVLAITAPLLRTAVFTNAACMFTSTALTKLSIVGTVPSDSDLMTWEPRHKDLRTILEAHRHTLQHLCLDINSDIRGPLPPRIDFPGLQSLDFHGSSIGPNSLICNISYPQSTRTHVRIEPTSPINAQTLGSFISALQRAGSVAPYGLAIEEIASFPHEEPSLLLHFYAAPDMHASSPESGMEDYIFGIETLWLTLKIEEEHVPLHTLLKALSTSIPMTGVKTLSFQSSCESCRFGGALLTNHFPAVQTLHLVDACRHDASVLPSLSHWSATTGPRMPMLERLLLSQISQTHILSANWLAQQLLARYGHYNAPNTLARLKELVIHQSVTVANEKEFTQAVTAIRALVDSLIWQGHRVGMGTS